jgi:hypothetical protein
VTNDARSSPPWVISGPTPTRTLSTGIRRLQDEWFKVLIADHVYSREQVDAQMSAEVARECSWAPPPEQLSWPHEFNAKVGAQVVGGLALYKNLRDGYWFVENVIRDQSDAYKGVGQDLVRAALTFLWSSGVTHVRVHSLVPEQRSGRYWRWLLGREPDFDAYLRAGDFEFKAVGWIIEPGWLPDPSTG